VTIDSHDSFIYELAVFFTILIKIAGFKRFGFDPGPLRAFHQRGLRISFALERLAASIDLKLKKKGADS